MWFWQCPLVAVDCLPEDLSIYSNKDESMGGQRNAQSEWRYLSLNI